MDYKLHICTELKKGGINVCTIANLHYPSEVMSPMLSAKTAAYALALGTLPPDGDNEERRYVRLSGKWNGVIYAAFHANTGEEVREFYADA